MEIVESHDYRFPSILLPALVNNEPVIDEDRESFYAFLDKLEKYKKEYNAKDYIIEYGKDSYFAKSNCLFDVGCNVTDIKCIFIR